MKDEEKMTASLRQKLILERLKQTEKPITGTTFAAETNVSRQVIVQDISILKAKNEPIIATNRGYLYMKNDPSTTLHQFVIAVQHTPEQVHEELNIIVDQGVTVKDVTVEHAVYGDLTASIMVSNRAEVASFIKKINETKAPYLSVLTEGVHLHTLEADDMDKIHHACQLLKEAHFLL